VLVVTAATTVAVLGLGAAALTSADRAGPAAAAASPTGPVAVVDGTAIAQAAFDARLGTVTADPDVATAVAEQPGVGTRLRADVLAQMIEARLLEQAAPSAGVELTEDDVQRYVEETTRGFLGEEPGAWERFLAEKGYPEQEVRGQLREDLLRERLEDRVASVEVTPEQVQQAFAAGWEGRPRVAHVLVETREEADAVLAELRAGADLAAVARERSLDTASAVSGGELGPWSEGDFTPAFDQAVERAAGAGPREPVLLEPVASPFGWHVIRTSPPAALPEVAPLITESLAEQQQDDSLAGWVARHREHAEVTVREDLGAWDAGSGAVVTS
jgi:parvulin-like peptidyl-prolyl isomerase